MSETPAQDEPSPEESPALPQRSVGNEPTPSDPSPEPPSSVETAASIGPTGRKRPVWLHLVVLFFQLLLLVPLYALLLAASVGGGVGWHYFDESASLDLERVGRPEVGALVRDVRGVEIGRAGSQNRLLVSREEIPDHLVDALLAAEDQRFFLHPGFDPMGSARAALANYRAEAIREGGSTLTQQLARDVYGLRGKEIDRKLSEIAAAVRIERRYSKDEILVHYLNRVYFGSGFYGIGAAARGYFGKRVADLSIDESALLCGVIPSPSRYSPLVSPERARTYRDQTLRRMNENGRLGADELASLLASETKIADSREDSLERGQIAYLVARVERELRAETARWRKPPETLDHYTIETSVDLAAQQEAAKAIDRHLARLETENGGIPGGQGGEPLEAAFLLLENRTGQIVLSVGSRDYQRSEYDRTVETKRSPGSAFLPFLYAAAYESGDFTPETVLLDAPFDNREMGLGAVAGLLGEWSTENPENRWQGEIPAGEALKRSKNSPSARLGLQVGVERLGTLARACGIESELTDAPGSLLGASEASLAELTRAYAVFPNFGRPAPALRMIREIRDPKGRIVARLSAKAPAPAMKESNARAILTGIPASKGLPGARGKPGTTPAFTDAWHFGFDETHTWGIWVGRDRFAPIRPLAFGGEIATPLAEQIVAAARPASRAPVASSPAAPSEKRP